jgi:hypothetical protein
VTIDFLSTFYSWLIRCFYKYEHRIDRKIVCRHPLGEVYLHESYAWHNLLVSIDIPFNEIFYLINSIWNKTNNKVDMSLYKKFPRFVVLFAFNESDACWIDCIVVDLPVRPWKLMTYSIKHQRTTIITLTCIKKISMNRNSWLSSINQ